MAPAPIYRMYGYIVNFGAAIVAALGLACSSASSNTENADTPAAQQAVKKTLNAPDPLVVAADRGRIAGDSTAKTWVVIASDFQCPFCREWHGTSYRALVDNYVKTGKVRVAYLHFPLGQHQNAVPTANAAMCAGVQNRFWEYHDALFQSQERWARLPDPRVVLDSIAKAVGLDTRAWAQCYESGRMIPLIRADRNRAATGGVQSTPTFLVGGQVVAGAVPWETLRPVIDAAVARDRQGGSAAR
jgi:protein-disulfide isomerase